MLKTQSSAAIDELLLPETRKELRQQLRQQFRRTHRKSAAPPKDSASLGFGANRRGADLISPMRRGEVPPIDRGTTKTTPQTAVPTGPPRSVEAKWPQTNSWLQKLQDPHYVRQLGSNLRVRRGFWILLVSAGIFLFLLLFIVFIGDDPKSEAPADSKEIEIPAVASMNSSSAVTEPIHENKTTTEKSVSTSQVTIFVPGSNNVRIEVDDSVHYNTNKVTLPLTPGMHRLKITRDGYQTVDRSFEVLAIAKQELPAVTLQAIINPEAPKSIQTPVAAQPASEQPAVLFQEPLLPEISPRVTTADEYGITLTQSEEQTLKSAIDTILRSDWDASPKVAVAHAELHRAASARFAQWEPRLDHAYGLLLWHHGEMRKARDAMTEAVKREQTRPGRRIPYYALYRDKIRLQIVTDEEAKATESLLDLARDTAGTLKSYPGMGFHEARQNADFIGRMMGFLEGPSHARVAHEVNLRLLSSRIEESFPSSELQEAYKSARMELRSQYEKERAQVEALQQARVARQRALQDSGELGRTNIRVKNSRFNGKRDRSDYGNLPALPIRVSAGSNVFATEKGTVEFFNGAAADYRPNPLFISGPAISRSYFNNRTNGTIRDKRKVALEELPKISSRRPQSLTTYVPQELERKRRQILESVNRSNADAE